MTGLPKKRSATTSACSMAAASSSASMSNRKALPARTPVQPAEAQSPRARSMVAPWGSAIPGRNDTSTSTE